MSVRWRCLHLFFADVALYWFADGDPDPLAMLEMGMLFDSSVHLVVGASPGCTRRSAMAAHLRYLDETEVVHDTLAAASGSFGSPYLSVLPGQEDFAGEVLHGAAYRDPKPYAGKRVVWRHSEERGASLSDLGTGPW